MGGGSSSAYLNMDQFELEIAAEATQGRVKDDALEGQIDPNADAPEGDEMTGEERSGRGPSRMLEDVSSSWRSIQSGSP